ncbi:1,4-dihydroxy-2-naphthoate octaprenyltransferase [Halobacteriovorax vibrionivorans]|uniref:1,4-dihydroxy-2-naphthoate octaprenyltransferase n=1 Tax=Halobacteriovorax vibrionivorans TaxID=2152716 RepID=A0ABY0IC70_9BACT|nr:MULTISPECIES: 1,4-dihydroxy-2-naphthoate octaprenyltransferase [Halobacteriovorax]RZF20558.1 1,4-dihydroxy-2-naphthoate octaprenyltransferase [Halobacteriovorax vibrionivorans]TGD47471.1 1,4-dihydroxy-2-naphthoate octaprenyltransferase [Halobacteriovorax sp. Y22]
MKDNIKGFILASRPKTLPAGASPIIMATALAYSDTQKFSLIIFILTLLCTVLLQIASNLINDYYDTQTGVDTEERLGPTRVTSSGQLKASTVKTMFISTLVLAFILGIYLMYVGGPIIIAMGLISMLASYLYTGSPFPLSHYALGELLALIFFGCVAVCGAYYLQTKQITNSALLLSLFPGFLSSAIMAINNARDINSDTKAKKLTLGILLNKLRPNLSSWLPLIFVICANIVIIVHSVIYEQWYLSFAVVGLVLPFLKTWIYLILNRPSVEYNNSLAKTGKFLFLSSLIYGGLLWIN